MQCLSVAGNMTKCPLQRGVRLWEGKSVVSLYVARNMTKCPLTRGVRVREVSVSEGSTVPTLMSGRFHINISAVMLMFMLMSLVKPGLMC